MKRQLTFIILSLFLLAGCTKEELLPTEIKVKMESVTGSRARFTVAPSNSRAYYSYVLVNPYDEDYDAPTLDICYNAIKRMEEGLPPFDENVTFEDIFCYQGNRQLTMKKLSNDSEFKIIVFQINPQTHEVIGDPVVRGFRTKPVPERDLHFQVDFVADEVHITPSNNDLTYFWQIGETEKIYNSYGSISNYLYEVVGLYQEYGFMDYFYYQGPYVWDLSLKDNMKDGTQYSLVIHGCEEGEFTTPTTIVKFIYHPNNVEVVEVIEGNEWQS